MSFIKLHAKKPLSGAYQVQVPFSKSLHNRWLILKFLYFPNLEILGVVEANDTKVLNQILCAQNFNGTIDAQDAGTAFRFLTAFLAATPSDCILTGTKRMKNRPIGQLVKMLQMLGADITYLENVGFPPLKIKGKKLEGGFIKVDNLLSSQFLSALALLAPAFEKGLTIELPSKLNSKPYWDMTLGCMKNLGIAYSFELNRITILPFQKQNQALKVRVEKDWSAASFWFLLPVLKPEIRIFIHGVNSKSMQGDAIFLLNIASQLGLGISEKPEGIYVEHLQPLTDMSKLDFTDAPDLALNFIVLLALLRKRFVFKGLDSLAIKESDRTQAISTELKKLGVIFSQELHDWVLHPKNLEIPLFVSFKTYNDHRIAMALSYIAFITKIEIAEPKVVQKSYPEFWKELSKICTIEGLQ
jgi:3-phosphoshikimate 1-carboxyvinyltransferase